MEQAPDAIDINDFAALKAKIKEMLGALPEAIPNSISRIVNNLSKIQAVLIYYMLQYYAEHPDFDIFLDLETKRLLSDGSSPKVLPQQFRVFFDEMKMEEILTTFTKANNIPVFPGMLAKQCWSLLNTIEMIAPFVNFEEEARDEVEAAVAEAEVVDEALITKQERAITIVLSAFIDSYYLNDAGDRIIFRVKAGELGVSVHNIDSLLSGKWIPKGLEKVAKKPKNANERYSIKNDNTPIMFDTAAEFGRILAMALVRAFPDSILSKAMQGLLEA